jgi:hypothetical protein
MIALRNQHRTTLQDVAAFLIPVFSWCEFTIVGRIFLTDILLLLTFPLVLRRSVLERILPAIRVLAVLGVLWLANQIVTDVMRGTGPADFSRGWAKIGLATMNLVTLAAILGSSRRRLKLFALGFAAGALIAIPVNPDPFFWADHWKFGYSVPFNLAMALFASTIWSSGHRKLSCVVFVSLPIINISLGFRGAAGASFLAFVLLCLGSRKPRRSGNGPMRAVIALLVLAIGGAGFIGLYEVSALRGWLGEDLREKTVWQTSGDLGILIGGRGPVFAALAVIAENPIFGLGSWADSSYYVLGMSAKMGDHGYALQDGPVETHASSHSHVLGSWVEAGALGALFWCAVIWLVGCRIMSVPWHDERVAPLILYLAFSLLWDIAFSPFAQERRFLTPYYIDAVLITGARFGRVGRHPGTRRRRAPPSAGGRIGPCTIPLPRAL